MTRKEERKTISPSTSFPKNPHHQQQQQKTKKQAELGTEDDFSPSSSRSSSSSSSNAATTAATAAAAAARKIFIPKHGVGIRVEQLYKRYDPLRAGGESFVGAAGFDLEIAPNKLTALVGPSGSGKTTFLRLVSGLEDPTSGRVYLGGRDVTDLSTRERRVGVVFQGYALFKHMTVAENIGFGPRMLRLPGDPDARVRDLLELVELPHVARRFPGQLSGGQRQRVALARALAAEPKVLLLDEPFSALDPEVRAALRAGLSDVLRRAGVTAVMVSHDQAEAFEMADDVVVFRRGAPAAQGAPAELRSSPGSPFVMDFVHEANKLPADCALVRRSGFATRKQGAMCAPCDVECVQRVDAAAPSFSSYTPVTVVDRSFAGNVIKYRIRCEGEGGGGVELEAHVPSNATALTPAGSRGGGGGRRRTGAAAAAGGGGGGGGEGGDGRSSSSSSSPSSASNLPPLLEQLEVGSRAYARCPPDRFMGFQAEDLEA